MNSSSACLPRAWKFSCGAAQGERLFHWISEQPLQGPVDLFLAAIPGKRRARQAKLQLCFGQLSILPPGRLQPQSQPIDLYFVEAPESAESVPAKEKPVHWRLPVSYTHLTLPTIRSV